MLLLIVFVLLWVPRAGGAGCASTAPTPTRLLLLRFACQPLGGFGAALLPL